jgi:hypothetical protein
MRLRGLAALVVVASAAQRGAAADYATELHFVRNGAPLRTIDLATLKANCQVQTISIDDPYYHRGFMRVSESFLVPPHRSDGTPLLA